MEKNKNSFHIWRTSLGQTRPERVSWLESQQTDHFKKTFIFQRNNWVKIIHQIFSSLDCISICFKKSAIDRLYHSRLVCGQPRPTVMTEGVFFHQNFVTDNTKIPDIQQGLSFSPEFCHRPYQNSGHTGGSFFFTRILSPTIPKFRTYRRAFLFHQNFEKETPFEIISNAAVLTIRPRLAAGHCQPRGQRQCRAPYMF